MPALLCALVLVTTPAVGHAHGQQIPAALVKQEPVRIFGNTYYVGTRGVAAILITSTEGHVLIDGTMSETAPDVMANIVAAGFRVQDIRLILNSHTHHDHAGGIGPIQRASGAAVAATRWSRQVLQEGRTRPGDPLYGLVPAIEVVDRVEVVEDGDTLRVGPTAMTTYATGGHTPGGTSWSWRSCEVDRCVNMVYADSLTAVSAETFSFTRSTEYPTALADFDRSFSTLSAIPCDILLTPHPEASDLWGRLAQRARGAVPDPLIDATACRRYANTARKGLAARVAREMAAR